MKDKKIERKINILTTKEEMDQNWKDLQREYGIFSDKELKEMEAKLDEEYKNFEPKGKKFDKNSYYDQAIDRRRKEETSNYLNNLFGCDIH